MVEGQVVLDAAGDDLLRFGGRGLGALAVGVEPGEVGLHAVAPQRAGRRGDQGVAALDDAVDVGPLGDPVLVRLLLGHDSAFLVVP